MQYVLTDSLKDRHEQWFKRLYVELKRLADRVAVVRLPEGPDPGDQGLVRILEDLRDSLVQIRNETDEKIKAVMTLSDSLTGRKPVVKDFK